MTYRRAADHAKQQGEDDRDFDTTSLKLNGTGQVVHRDYGAHFFRWGFARRLVKGGQRVLDIGCGPEQALAREFAYQPSMCPKEMVMVDYGNVKPRYHLKWGKVIPNFDFTKQWNELKPGFDVITCFEVIEHMQKAHGRKLLKGAHALLKINGTFLLSTPVFSPKVGMARNHIHEYGVAELQKEIERAGFTVKARYGTFMNHNEAKKVSDPAHRKTWEALTGYYSSDVLACFLAPLYPDQSRNNMWILKRS